MTQLFPHSQNKSSSRVILLMMLKFSCTIQRDHPVHEYTESVRAVNSIKING